MFHSPRQVLKNRTITATESDNRQQQRDLMSSRETLFKKNKGIEKSIAHQGFPPTHSTRTRMACGEEKELRSPEVIASIRIFLWSLKEIKCIYINV
jgi:hypothetical protein